MERLYRLELLGQASNVISCQSTGLCGWLSANRHEIGNNSISHQITHTEWDQGQDIYTKNYWQPHGPTFTVFLFPALGLWQFGCSNNPCFFRNSGQQGAHRQSLQWTQCWTWFLKVNQYFPSTLIFLGRFALTTLLSFSFSPFVVVRWVPCWNLVLQRQQLCLKHLPFFSTNNWVHYKAPTYGLLAFAVQFSDQLWTILSLWIVLILISVVFQGTNLALETKHKQTQTH
jgi:hypothetical protein